MTWRLASGALFASELSYNESPDNEYSMLARADKSYIKHMGSARLFIREKIHLFAHTFVSIINYMLKSVKRQMYQHTIGPSCMISEGSWRRKKKQKARLADKKAAAAEVEL